MGFGVLGSQTVEPLDPGGARKAQSTELHAAGSGHPRVGRVKELLGFRV